MGRIWRFILLVWAMCAIKYYARYWGYKLFKGKQLVSFKLVCSHCNAPWAWGRCRRKLEWVDWRASHAALGKCPTLPGKGAKPFFSPVHHQCCKPGLQGKIVKQPGVVSTPLPPSCHGRHWTNPPPAEVGGSDLDTRPHGQNLENFIALAM